jgi:hypothetical protein
MAETKRPSRGGESKSLERSRFKRDGEVPQSTKDQLDEFIEATFPASDPFCLSNPVDRVGTPG